MKKRIATKLLNLLLISVGLSVFGYFLDSDSPGDLSTTIFELIMMTIILFLIVSGIYFGSSFTYRKVRQLFS
jgi:threonine/homoserine/homoserine lactone efflux protein